jgi:UDP-N-acetylmuramoylalanine-D-glutamate ligase
VLLSPAAPSYNSYRNFEERGDHFATLARDVPDTRSQ